MGRVVWDCLDLFALNVSSVFASKNEIHRSKIPSHSTHRSLEPRQPLRSVVFFKSQKHQIIKYLITLVIRYFMGRVVGFEPTHIGTTIRGLNRLAIPAISFTFLY